MARRTIHVHDALDARIRAAAETHGSYSSAVADLVEAGLRARDEEGTGLDYLGAFDGPGDLSVRVDQILGRGSEDP